jgi:ribonuclease P/MRP protein subunit RPP1
MRRFIDLHVKSPPELDGLREMLELAAKLGFSGLGMVADRALFDSAKGMAPDQGLDLVSRADLRPKSPRDLTASLGRMRGRFEMIAVECQSKAVARQAAKDNRVDVLCFPTTVQERRKVGFDRQEASLAAGANCSYEVNVSDLLGKSPKVASGLTSIIREEVENARRFDVPLVVSSGAVNPLLMRDPRGLASVLNLFDIGEEEGLEAVSTTPWRLVETNRGKLGPGYVLPGVRVV